MTTIEIRLDTKGKITEFNKDDMNRVHAKHATLTSPEKHDIIMIRRGNKVRMAELAEDKNKRVTVMCGETTYDEFKELILTLAPNHNLGVITVIVGSEGETLTTGFLKKHSIRQGFRLDMLMGPAPLKECFDCFFDNIKARIKGN